MKTSKLIRNLQLLSKEEMKQLRPFLQSPYYNTNSKIVKLYRVLFLHHPEFKSPKLAREKVFEKVFPGRNYAHQQLLNLMSEFNQLLQQYLIIKTLEKKEIMQEKLLLKAYAERPGCYDTFIKKYKLLNKKLDEMPYRDEVYFQEKKELNLLFYGHPDSRLQKQDQGTLAAAVKNFEAYTELATIKLQCAQNARINTIVEGKKETVPNPISVQENALFQFYRALELFQRNEDTKHFEVLFSSFESSINLMRTEDRKSFLTILLNFCTRKTNSGQSQFFKPAFELYKLGLAYDCLLRYGKITETTFHNIASLGAMLKEFDWTEKFMENYKDLLGAKVKADALALGYGFWYFEQKKYNDALDALQHTFREPLDVFKSKSLVIRCWFERWLEDEGYFELLLAQLEAFEKFTRRDYALKPKLRENFLRFIAYTKKLTLSWWDKNAVQKLNQEMEGPTNVVFKKWLLEKAGQRK